MIAGKLKFAIYKMLLKGTLRFNKKLELLKMFT